MAKPLEPNSHPYVLSNVFPGLRATMDLHNSLLNSEGAGAEGRERFVPGAFLSGETCSFFSQAFTDTAKKTKFNCDKRGVVTAAIVASLWPGKSKTNVWNKR